MYSLHAGLPYLCSLSKGITEKKIHVWSYPVSKRRD